MFYAIGCGGNRRATHTVTTDRAPNVSRPSVSVPQGSPAPSAATVEAYDREALASAVQICSTAARSPVLFRVRLDKNGAPLSVEAKTTSGELPCDTSLAAALKKSRWTACANSDNCEFDFGLSIPPAGRRA